MLPIILDASKVLAGLAGKGEGFARRLKVLREGGVTEPILFEGRLPTADEISRLQILFVAGLSEADSHPLAMTAREAGVLVNVEDVPLLCDFHLPAQVRRGELGFTISTCGRSPALSRILREYLESQFGPEWGEHLDEIAQLRAQWRAQGTSPDIVSERTRALISERGWLP
jgi:precorrin-2 dehydrogenase/sirohydrochlorin ferrochelatase